MATTYLSRTFSSPTNRKIWTWSAWVKRQNQVSNYANALFGAYYDGNNRSVIRFNENELNFQDTANSVEIKTNRLFRDVSAWYHIVARVDTTQGTASDRIRLYVNGEQQTSFKQAAYPAQNDNMQFNGADPHYINARNSSGSVDSIADMSYSHVHFLHMFLLSTFLLSYFLNFLLSTATFVLILTSYIALPFPLSLRPP